MLRLEIPFDSTDLINLDIKINNTPVSYSVVDNKLRINENISCGLHILYVKNLNESKIKFNNIFVNDTNIRQFLYLSWVEDGNEKLQPCTELWNTNQTWIVPISLPLSMLISQADEKFTAGDLGSNLFDKYKIFYPESIELKGQYPQLVKDFFQYNFGFHIYSKEAHRDPYASEVVPYYNFDFAFDESAIYKELTDNQEYILENESIPSQVKYNNLDLHTKSRTANWRTVFTYPFQNGKGISINDFSLDKQILPELFKFYESLPMSEIYLSFLGLLPAGGYIAPHRDSAHTKIPKGCSQLYFAINAKEGNFLKIHNVGLVPYQSKPTVLNNQSFTHALVNESDEPRWVISVLGNLNQQLIGVSNA